MIIGAESELVDCSRLVVETSDYGIAEMVEIPQPTHWRRRCRGGAIMRFPWRGMPQTYLICRVETLTCREIIERVAGISGIRLSWFPCRSDTRLVESLVAFVTRANFTVAKSLSKD